MTDLSDLRNLTEEQDRGAELVILHPVTGEKTDLKMIVAGPDSDRQRIARIKLQDELMAFKKVPAAELERLELERLARCIISWQVTEAGAVLALTHSAAMKLLTDMLFVREQLAAFAASRIPYFERLPFVEAA